MGPRWSTAGVSGRVWLAADIDVRSRVTTPSEYFAKSKTALPWAMNISYQIDEQDRLIQVSEMWETFARENGGPLLVGADRLRPSLWSFISGQETVHFYKLLIQRVRDQQVSMTIPYRCDALAQRRYMTLTLRPGTGGNVEFLSQNHRNEDREPLAILEPGPSHSSDFIVMCSFCKQVAFGGGWGEIEAASASMRLFERELPPRISHGACPDCHKIVMDQLETSQAPSNSRALSSVGLTG